MFLVYYFQPSTHSYSVIIKNYDLMYVLLLLSYNGLGPCRALYVQRSFCTRGAVYVLLKQTFTIIKNIIQDLLFLKSVVILEDRYAYVHIIASTGAIQWYFRIIN